MNGKRILELIGASPDNNGVSTKENQIRFISNQMILTDTKGATSRIYTQENIIKALNKFLRRRSARGYAFSARNPCSFIRNTPKVIFWKTRNTGKPEFIKLCFITADGILF